MIKQQLSNTLGVLASVAVLLLATRIGPPNPSQQTELPPALEDEQTSAIGTVLPAGRDLHSPMPPPTEHWLDEDAEKAENKARRKAWHKRMHRAPPGVDWKAIELGNGRRQLDKRNALKEAPPAPPPGEHEIVPAWQERGSDNQAGRMMCARHGTDPDVLYGGSAKGGIWKGSREGTDWIPIGDNLYGGAHDIEVVSGESDGDPDIVIATAGGWIHRSNDDGATWEIPAGLGSTWATLRTLTLSDGSELIFLLLGADDGYQLFRSDDGGESFESIYDLGDLAGDVWAPRDGGSELYLYDGSSVLVSEDYGDSWTERGSAPIPAESGQLVGSEAGAPVLWLALDSRTLWRSEDAGESWSFITDLSDYWASLNASVTDPDVFAWGGVEVHRTDDAGENFEVVNYWWDYYDDPANLLHADIMGIDVIVDEGGDEIWYIDTDGGLYRSLDRLETVENLSLRGLRVSQYYSTHTSATNPAAVLGGTQDQGYQITAGIQQDGDGVWEFDQIISGDYGHLTSSDGTHDYVFSVYPGFILVQMGEINPSLAYLDFPADDSYVPWLPPIVADPDDKNAFFFPATRLYRYDYNAGLGTWQYALHSEHNFEVSSGEYISSIRFSPLDSRRVYAATSTGRFWTSDDHGITWTQSQNMVADDNWYYGQTIAPSRTDIDTVTIGGSGYGVPAVYRSTNGGLSFSPLDEGLPDTLVYGLVEARDGSGRLFAGTETAAYLFDPETELWSDITSNDAPVTTYWTVEALWAENTIRFGTYGRGIWDYQLDPDHLGCYPVQDWDMDGYDCESDCDDHQSDISPDGEEICGNGIDEDCDGLDLECEPQDTGELIEPDSGQSSDDGAEAVDEVEDPTSGGCGCSSTADHIPWPLASLFGLSLLRRRHS
jgi:MYXO-CTERM domain-containing protein